MMPGVKYVIYIYIYISVYISIYLCMYISPWISLPELNTGGNYCCSYYSRQGDGWQFKKSN